MSVWTGSKGDLTRPLAVGKDERDNNYESIFGKKMTWLDWKKVREAWLLKV